jgi:hypothetical protein
LNPIITSTPNISKSIPVAQNSNQEVVPVVEEVAKEVITTDKVTG